MNLNNFRGSWGTTVNFTHLALSSQSIVADILTAGAIIIRMSQSDLEVAPLRDLFIFGDTRL